MKLPLAILILIYSLLFSLTASADDTLTFDNPWIPEAPPGARVMAGYMEISNHATKTIDIVSISSEAFDHVEMHLSKESDGFAQMLPQKKLSIPANGKLVLTSGSFHLMLIKPVKWFKHGDNIKLRLTLSNNETLPLEMRVKKTTPQKMKCAAGKCGAN